MQKKKSNVLKGESECRRKSALGEGKEHFFSFHRKVTTVNICISALVSSSSEWDQPWKSFSYSFFWRRTLLSNEYYSPFNEEVKWKIWPFVTYLFWWWSNQQLIYLTRESEGCAENSESAWRKRSEVRRLNVTIERLESESENDQRHTYSWLLWQKQLIFYCLSLSSLCLPFAGCLEMNNSWQRNLSSVM